MLSDRLNEDIELQKYIKLIFNQPYVENLNLDEVLVNKMIKYVVLEKIKVLQEILVQDNSTIEWK